MQAEKCVLFMLLSSALDKGEGERRDWILPALEEVQCAEPLVLAQMASAILWDWNSTFAQSRNLLRIEPLVLVLEGFCPQRIGAAMVSPKNPSPMQCPCHRVNKNAMVIKI